MRRYPYEAVREDSADIMGSSFPPAHIRKAQNRQIIPQRTTKTTEKLVLFPDEQVQPSFMRRVEDQLGYEILVPEMQDLAQTEAERLRREERYRLPRATCYCLAESFKMEQLENYLKDFVHPVKYDECLYACYEPMSKEKVFEEATWMTRSEVFLFDYGVVVLWNFTKEEELAYVKTITKYMVDPLSFDDVEIEDFHFQYDLDGTTQPRIFNDMITLRSHNPLIKLTISHGLAQSVKLAFFENVMEDTIVGTTPLPLMMAKYGQVKMTRQQVMKIVGRLFKLKINVNLISNILDTPEVFWSEPELQSFYEAVRGYLEIDQRAKLLNTRADVLADLLEMLSDHLNSKEMTWITWIIIILICAAVVIAICEVVVKFMRLSAGLE